MLEALAASRCENPAGRKPDACVNFSQRAQVCKATALHLMINACREGPVILRRVSERVLVTLLRLIGRR
eukprot:11218178-Lingulodinium_polyedra.AAC.1